MKKPSALGDGDNPGRTGAPGLSTWTAGAHLRPRVGPPARGLGVEIMRTRLSLVIDSILGRVPGKTSRLDTATKMAMTADFSDRHESVPFGLNPWNERDDRHLAKSADPLADIGLLEELIRIVNEAQKRDAEDERRLYDPMLRDRPIRVTAPRGTDRRSRRSRSSRE
jgi:hypothetical protein